MLAPALAFTAAECDPEPDFDLTIQKVCYCEFNDGSYRFWFEITSKNDIPVDYYWKVSTNPVTGSGTIGAGVGPSVTRKEYFYVDVPASDVPGLLRLYRTCDDSFQQSIGFNPPNFDHCDRCPYPTLLDPNITVIADPTGCIYTSPATAGDYFVVTAYVTDYTLGPLIGADVTFTIDTAGESLATFDAVNPNVHEIVYATNANGIATAYVYHDAGSYKSGDVVVTATVSDNTFAPDFVLTSSDSTTVSFCPVCETLTLTIDDTPLDAHTPSTTLRASLVDYAGDPMPDGIYIGFSTTVGTISDVTPLLNGVATATLTYDATSLPINAIVSAASICGADDSIMVPYLPIYEGDLLLSAVPSIASLCHGSTNLYAHFTSETLDVSGRSVEFEVVNTPTGTYQLDPVSAVTNEDGVAVVELSNDVAETVSVKATLTVDTATFESDVVDVEFTPATVASVELVSPTDGPDPISIDTCLGEPLEVTVVVKDCLGEVMDGVPVYFSTTAGSFSSSPVVSDGDGLATALLYPSGNVEIAHVTVSCPCGENIDFDVTFAPGEPCFIDAYADPVFLPADGTSITLIHADVYDCCGNPVENGIQVCFVTDHGTLLYVPPHDETYNGTAHMPLQSSLEDVTATVVAYLCEDDSINDSTQVVFEPLPREFETEDTWSPFIPTPVMHANLSRGLAMWDCLQSNLPESVPEDVVVLLDELQAHIQAASTLTNPIYATGELAYAIGKMCEISEELERDCCDA